MATCPECGETKHRRRRCRLCERLVCRLCITTTDAMSGGPSCRRCDDPERRANTSPVAQLGGTNTPEHTARYDRRARRRAVSLSMETPEGPCPLCVLRARKNALELAAREYLRARDPGGTARGEFEKLSALAALVR